MVNLLVQKQPRLTARVRVASDGNVTASLTNQVVAAGCSASQLQDDLMHPRPLKWGAR
jgi:hypothetical protein